MKNKRKKLWIEGYNVEARRSWEVTKHVPILEQIHNTHPNPPHTLIFLWSKFNNIIQ